MNPKVTQNLLLLIMRGSKPVYLTAQSMRFCNERIWQKKASLCPKNRDIKRN